MHAETAEIAGFEHGWRGIAEGNGIKKNSIAAHFLEIENGFMAQRQGCRQ